MKKLILAIGLICISSAGVLSADELDLIAAPRFDEVKTRTLDWVASQQKADPQILAQVAPLWVEPAVVPSSAALFANVIETFRVVDPRAAEFIDASQLGTSGSPPPTIDLIEGPFANDFSKTNLAQHLGIYLVRRKYYDEALIAFEKVQLPESADPAGYLFHLAVAQSELLMQEEGLATLEKLLKKTESVPTRYKMLASLMEHQLSSIEENSLDEVAQKMKDIERRLGLGRGGQKTQKKEEEVITLLDEIIKKVEQSNSSSSSGQGNGGNTNQPGGGAQESVVKGTTAPGETDEKKLKKQAGWGALPEAEVTKAKNLLKRDFPENYRRAVEAYFRKSAGRDPAK